MLFTVSINSYRFYLHYVIIHFLKYFISAFFIYLNIYFNFFFLMVSVNYNNPALSYILYILFIIGKNESKIIWPPMTKSHNA